MAVLPPELFCAAATGRDMWSEQPHSAVFLGYAAANYKTDGSKEIFYFLGYRIQRNKYSGSIAASKPKGKVKCKHFSDFLVDLQWPFQPSSI